MASIDVTKSWMFWISVEAQFGAAEEIGEGSFRRDLFHSMMT